MLVPPPAEAGVYSDRSLDGAFLGGFIISGRNAGRAAARAAGERRPPVLMRVNSDIES